MNRLFISSSSTVSGRVFPSVWIEGQLTCCGYFLQRRVYCSLVWSRKQMWPLPPVRETPPTLPLTHTHTHAHTPRAVVVLFQQQFPLAVGDQQRLFLCSDFTFPDTISVLSQTEEQANSSEDVAFDSEQSFYYYLTFNKLNKTQSGRLPRLKIICSCSSIGEFLFSSVTPVFWCKSFYFWHRFFLVNWRQDSRVSEV